MLARGLGRLLGPKHAPQPDITLGVRLGFARELGLDNQSAATLEEILTIVLPSTDARLLEALHVAWDSEMPMGVGAVFKRLAGEVTVPPSLRRLKLGNAFENDADDRIVQAEYDDDSGEELVPEPEDLRAVLTMFPRLRELVLDLGVVPVRLAPLATKNLEVLSWITPRLSPEEIDPLGGSVLPGLRRFELWIGGVYGHDDGMTREEEPGDDLDVVSSLPLRRLEPVLAMLERCTQLRELAFGHCHRLGALFEILGSHPLLLGRLQTLELSHVEIDDAGELIDFMRATPTLELVLEGASASERTRDSLECRRGPLQRARGRESGRQAGVRAPPTGSRPSDMCRIKRASY